MFVYIFRIANAVLIDNMASLRVEFTRLRWSCRRSVRFGGRL